MKRPNILFLMADQLAAPALPVYGGATMKTPVLSQLAQRSAVFESAYCNFPICAPSRYSMLSGRLPHAIHAFDNACEMPSELPTMAHYLGAAGYKTALAGKMHFVGPDQLHGFDERLTTDIYPAEFLWVPDWSKGSSHRPTGVGMGHVVDAGPSTRNMQMDYDEEVAHVAVQKLYDWARAPQTEPFFLTVSFTHPHPPFVAPQAFFDAYDPADIDMPAVPEIPFDELDTHSQWLYTAHGQDRHTVTAAHVRNARHAYYAMGSYVDQKIGEVLQALEQSGFADDTIVVFSGDHGEMLGERGMWYKQTFFEWSARVPLMVAWPGKIAPSRQKQVCSLVDLLPTLLDMAGQGGPSPTGPDAGALSTPAAAAALAQLDGHSLLPLMLSGRASQATEGLAIAEYSSEGVVQPSRMVREGRYKYIFTRTLAPMLFDVVDDPQELNNLAGQPQWAHIEQPLRERLLADWNPDEVLAQILASQARRLFLKDWAQQKGAFPDWTFEARPGDKTRFVRPTTHGGAVGAKPRQRFPFVQPTPPDKA